MVISTLANWVARRNHGPTQSRQNSSGAEFNAKWSTILRSSDGGDSFGPLEKVVEARPLAHIVSSDHIPLRVEFAIE